MLTLKYFVNKNKKNKKINNLLTFVIVIVSDSYVSRLVTVKLSENLKFSEKVKHFFV